MAYTQEQAQAYYNTLPQAEKTKVDAIGGPGIEWFTNAVNAGVPEAVKATGSSKSVYTGEGNTGDYADYSGAADVAEWYGKRKPTPQELRKWAVDQHAKYVSGDKSAQDEDYERFDDRTLAGWINEKWDVGKGGFFSPNGERIGKPPDVDSQGVNAYGETVGGEAGGGAGGGGKPKPPPEPTTFGNNLSMTGNTMQDMLIQQFNTGQASSYAQGNNIFGLGEDRAAGGAGANADMVGGEQTNKAQTLGGGGLWWGAGDFNAGFDASKKVADTPAPAQGQPAAQSQPTQSTSNQIDPTPTPAPAATTPTQGGTQSAPGGAQPGQSEPTNTYYMGGNANRPGYRREKPESSSTIAGMTGQYF